MWNEGDADSQVGAVETRERILTDKRSAADSGLPGVHADCSCQPMQQGGIPIRAAEVRCHTQKRRDDSR